MSRFKKLILSISRIYYAVFGSWLALSIALTLWAY